MDEPLLFWSEIIYSITRKKVPIIIKSWLKKPESKYLWACLCHFRNFHNAWTNNDFNNRISAKSPRRSSIRKYWKWNNDIYPESWPSFYQIFRSSSKNLRAWFENFGTISWSFIRCGRGSSASFDESFGTHFAIIDLTVTIKQYRFSSSYWRC